MQFNRETTTIPEVNSSKRIAAMIINIQLGAINFGYVLSYLTLSMDTLFIDLGIQEADQTSKLSLINGILPLGCVIGVIFAYYLKMCFNNKQCIIIGDTLGLLSLLTLINRLDFIVLFRFILGIANGISSLIMPVYVKSLCPEKYFMQLSLITGYGLNTGLMLGQLMGIPYIGLDQEHMNWWRVAVFSIPSIICFIRSFNILCFFNYDSPTQLILQKQEEKAKDLLKILYKEKSVQTVFEKYKLIANQQQKKVKFTHIFQKSKLITLQIGFISMLIQIWCGSFAVFQYSAQIFQQMAEGDVSLQTTYTVSIGIFSFFAQFSAIYLIQLLGTKYLLILGSVLLGTINIGIGLLSSFESNQFILFVIFLLIVLMIMIFASSIGPVAWSIVPQLNDDDATFFVMASRWAFQATLIFVFPFMVEQIEIIGSFILFGVLDFLYTIYTMFFIIDSRGLSHNQLMRSYKIKYRVIDDDQQEQQQNEIDQQDNSQDNIKDNIKDNENINNVNTDRDHVKVQEQDSK